MTRISDLSSLAAVDADTAADLVPVLDISETGNARNKRMTLDELSEAVASSVGGDFVPASYLDTDGTMAANSDAKVATQKAVRTYVSTAVTGLLEFKGSTDCSANPNYPAGLKGDAYLVTVAGKIGGASGEAVDAGDVYIASADNAGGTEASVGTSWFVIEHNGVFGAAYTDEQVRDAIGSALTDTGLVVVTPNDGADTIDINVPAAVASDINTGTDTSKALTADALAGSNFGKAVFQVWLSDLSTAITTGDGKAYLVVPAALNGMDLVAIKATLVVAQSTSGIPTVQIANVTDSVDILSTKLTIDANETDSATAAAAAVIDTSKDDVTTGDILRFDIDVAGTGAKGLVVTVTFQLP